jgi:hypothetical protein
MGVARAGYKASLGLNHTSLRLVKSCPLLASFLQVCMSSLADYSNLPIHSSYVSKFADGESAYMNNIQQSTTLCRN